MVNIQTFKVFYTFLKPLRTIHETFLKIGRVIFESIVNKHINIEYKFYKLIRICSKIILFIYLF